MAEAEDWPLTKAELARRWDVNRSAVTRAWKRAENDPALPDPPPPVNPGEPHPRYLPSLCDPWWAKVQRPRGRPTTRTPSPTLQEGPTP
ncbi:hypothetical protein [Streptosporangium sp. NPDC002524]|uniref:hypothetical protein n=1 Tax=Streptosporangium sp. NPDC002524 TaxID=3154537 RepID=UPI003316CBC7